ncbi:serine hydrolase domain-containing protein [Hyphomonas adhaerens]|uniref:serine hydrolase domain-containing protein n=1 Tax=Hyphomonas adhaerens TaxID=81029 RepID=UPI002355F143|nr:serine hydrolase domain-containing protein [Hyphomonas adhaerens]
MMKLHPLKSLLAGSVLALAALGASAEEAVPAPDAAVPAIPAEVTDRIDARFLDYQTEQHVPGLVWGIVKDGELVYFKTSGVANLETEAPVTADSLFSIASMSKAFTALAILKLRDEGKLYLDAPAEYYVPELRGWTYPTTDSPRIRVRDLLAHVSGLVTDNPWGDRQQDMPEEVFTEVLKEGVPFSRAPQMAYEYSNFGYALLGRIVTNLSGMPYEDYIRTEIMLPLGMTSTGYDVYAVDQDRRALGYRWEEGAFSDEPSLGPGVFGAMGGVMTNAEDYEKWVAFLLDAWPPRDGEETGPVKRASVRELSQGLNFPRVYTRDGLEEGETCDVAVNYAMGFAVTAECELGTTMAHSGGYPGYGSNVLLMPDAGVGVFAFANRTYAAPSRIVREAALELAAAGELPAREWPVSAPLADAYSVAGAVYEQGSFTPAEGKLAMNFTMDATIPVRERALADLKAEAGACDTGAPFQANGHLSGRFTWTCEAGDMEGWLLLSPNHPPLIQELNLSFVPAP